jgi:hypothetical protein
VGSYGGASSECQRWLNLFGGIVWAIFELRTCCAPNVGINSRSYLLPNTKTNVWVRRYENERGKTIIVVSAPRCPINAHLGVYL